MEEVTPEDVKRSADDRKAPPITTTFTPEAVRGINLESPSLHRLVPNRHDAKGAKTIRELSTLLQEDKKHQASTYHEINDNFKIVSTALTAQKNTVKTFQNEFRDSYQKLKGVIDSFCNIGTIQDSIQHDVNAIKLDTGILKSDINDVQSKLEYVSTNLDASELQVEKLENEHTRLKKVLDTHEIKINGLGGAKLTAPSTSGPRWSIQELMQADEYPLLKATFDKGAHYSQFLKGLKDVTLKDDNIISIENFWEKIDCAMMSALNSNKAIGRFDALTEQYDSKTWLLPPHHHSYYEQALNAYNTYERSLKTFLLTDKVIDPIRCPNSYEQLILFKDTQDGFQLLFTIVKRSNPNIGGPSIDLNKLVDSVQPSTDQTILQFYFQVLEINNQIIKTNDTSGQSNRLLIRFTRILFEQNIFTSFMLNIQIKLNKFFNIQRNYNQVPPYTFADIYKHLLNCGVTSTTKILPVSSSNSDQVLPVAIVNSGKLSRDDVHRNISLNRNKDNRMNTSGYKNSTSPRIQKQDYVKKRCECCGLTNREVHQLIHKYHDGSAKNCILRGPEFIPDKHIRETVTQFNVKAKNMKRPPLPPKATLPSSPKVNLAHHVQDVHQDSDSEELFYSKLLEQEDSFYQEKEDEYLIYDHVDTAQEMSSSPDPNISPKVNMTQVHSSNADKIKIPYAPKTHSAANHYVESTLNDNQKDISDSIFQDMLDELTFTEKSTGLAMKAVNLSPSDMLPEQLLLQNSLDSTPAYSKLWN